MFKILYIEDTENNRILISRRLGQSGYKVLTAETAELGLAVARAERPDLILMDMGLPGVVAGVPPAASRKISRSNPSR